MATNAPYQKNAATVQGPGPTGSEGYPLPVVPAPGSPPFPVGPAPGVCFPVEGCPGGPPVEVTFPTPVPVEGVDAEGVAVTVPPVYIGGRDEITAAATGLHTLTAAVAVGNVLNGPFLGAWLVMNRADVGIGQVIQGRSASNLIGNPPAGYVGVDALSLNFVWGGSAGGMQIERTPDFFTDVQAVAAGTTLLWATTPGTTFRLMRYCIQVTADASTAGGAVVTIQLFDGAATPIPGTSHDVFIPAAAVVAGNPPLYTSPWEDLGNGFKSNLGGNLYVGLTAALVTGNVRVRVAGVEEP